MNEVTKIHLGRQPFNISVAAHKALRSYLDGIGRQVGDEEVVEEVEMRMAELLAEHGITGDKVVLMKDVDYLKQQLGDPKDFKEDDEATPSGQPSDAKRLFRDTDSAMVAGVAAGLGKYFGLDVLLIRILFVVGTFAWGGGLLIYILLWLLVPEARTSSEKLQMIGKPVTVGSLKEVVERADVKGAATRANRTISGPINSFFDLVVKLIGIGFILVGLTAIFGLIAAITYLLLHAGNLVQDNLFPVGLREHLLLDVGLAVATLISVFVVLVGLAIFRRKWPIRTWITGLLVSLLFIGLATGGALAADTVPRVRDRYNTNVHTVTRSLPAFTQVTVDGDSAETIFQYSQSYSVSLRYYESVDPSKIKTTVANGNLVIDSRGFDWRNHCGAALCLPKELNMQVTVYSPNAPSVGFKDHGQAIFMGPNYPNLPKL